MNNQTNSQMTTPINNIPITSNVEPNHDIEDPLVKEILSNMQQNITQNIPQNITQNIPQNIQPDFMQNQHNYYQIPGNNKNFLIYDPKIIISSLIMIIIIYLIHTNNFDNIIKYIDNKYIYDYQIFIKYIILYIILYIIQKHGF